MIIGVKCQLLTFETLKSGEVSNVSIVNSLGLIFGFSLREVSEIRIRVYSFDFGSFQSRTGYDVFTFFSTWVWV